MNTEAHDVLVDAIGSSRSALDLILAVSNDDDVERANMAWSVLVVADQLSDAAMNRLIESLSASDISLSKKARAHMRGRALKPAAIREALSTAASDRDPSTRATALAIVGATHPTTASVDAMINALDDDHWAVRTSAVAALVAFAKRDARWHTAVTARLIAIVTAPGFRIDSTPGDDSAFDALWQVSEQGALGTTD